MKNAAGAFAVVRVDAGQSNEIDRISVKEIVWTLHHAEEEVARLNDLNAAKGAVYFWTPARVVNRSG